MRNLALLVVCGLFAATPALAGGDARAKAEEEFFRAYYQEHGRRDPDAARKAYTQFIWDHEESEDSADLCIRATLGLARVAARAESEDARKHLAAAKEWFDRVRTAIRSPVRVALEEEIASVSAFLANSREKDEVTEQIAGFLPELTVANDDARARAAEDALVAFGTRAIPQLVTALRGSNPRLVAGAARVLLRIQGDEATMVLTRALDDMDVLFPVQIAKQLTGAEARHLPVFEKACTHPLPEVRSAGVRAAGRWLEENGTEDSPLWDLVTELTEDAQESVSSAAIGSIGWQAGTVRRLRAAGAAGNRPALQRFLLTSWGLDSSSVGPEHTELIRDLLDSRDPSVRAVVFRLARERGGELADTAYLELLESPRLTDNLMAARTLTVDQGVGLNREVLSDLVNAAFRAYREQPEPTWQWVFETLVAPIRRLSGSTAQEDAVEALSPLVSAVANSTPTPRRKTAMALTLQLLEQLSSGRDTADLLIPSYVSLKEDTDRASWLRTFGDRLGAKAKGLAKAALQSPDGNLRFQAVRILAKQLDPDEIPRTLRPFLDDTSSGVREAAFSALAGVLEGSDLARIASAALEDEDAGVRAAAVRPMLDSGAGYRLRCLLSAVDRDPKLAPLAVKAVAEKASPDEAREFVVAVLEKLPDGGEHGELRAQAWQSAGAVLSDEMVLDAIQSGEPELIRVAALIAGRRRLLDAWPLLLSLDWDIPEAKAALETIREYHRGMKEFEAVRGSEKGDALEKARRLATSEDPVRRRAAALALAGLGTPAAISTLLDLVEDGDEAVRAAAMKALEKLGD